MLKGTMEAEVSHKKGRENAVGAKGNERNINVIEIYWILNKLSIMFPAKAAGGGG